VLLSAADRTAHEGKVVRRSIAGRERADVLDLGPVDDALSSGRAVIAIEPDQPSVLVVRTRKGVIAVQNTCPHLGLALDDATVRGHKLTCAHHGRRYDIRSGTCLSAETSPRARMRVLVTYRAWIQDGHVFIGLA
jgi:nitrite reductase/ring-hydroxylating ferredoxin subunit